MPWYGLFGIYRAKYFFFSPLCLLLLVCPLCVCYTLCGCPMDALFLFLFFFQPLFSLPFSFGGFCRNICILSLTVSGLFISPSKTFFLFFAVFLPLEFIFCSFLEFPSWLTLSVLFHLFWVLAVVGLRCCVRALSSCGEWVLFVVVLGLLISGASLVAEHRL